jgi:hypothetical protein
MTTETFITGVAGEYKALQVLKIVDGVRKRYVVNPDADLTGESQEVIDKANEVFTPEIKAAYAARMAEIQSAPPITIGTIKAEARRRILAKYPQWKQANMTARMVELNKIRASAGSWTAGEQIEVDAIQSAWDWVKSVRSASDALELTLPVDYNNNNLYWPES